MCVSLWLLSLSLTNLIPSMASYQCMQILSSQTLLKLHTSSLYCTLPYSLANPGPTRQQTQLVTSYKLSKARVATTSLQLFSIYGNVSRDVTWMMTRGQSPLHTDRHKHTTVYLAWHLRTDFIMKHCASVQTPKLYGWSYSTKHYFPVNQLHAGNGTKESTVIAAKMDSESSNSKLASAELTTTTRPRFKAILLLSQRSLILLKNYVEVLMSHI